MTTSAAALRPVVVGLTGSIGMGKSTATSWLRSAGMPVHDADACVHALYGPGGAAVEPVCAAFEGVRTPDGGVDRAALSQKVAEKGRDASLKQLEAIVHPLVTADRQAFIEQAAADGEWIVVLDVPLLMETMDEATRSSLLDALIVVSAPADVQRERVLARPGMTNEKFEFILSKQIADEVKRKAADFVIDTSAPSLSPARAQLAACMQQLATKHAHAYRQWCDSDAPPQTTTTTTPVAVRAVSFDLDDTLWPTMPPIIAAGKELNAAIDELMPKTSAALAAEDGALRRVASDVGKRYPLLAHDFTEMRRTSLLELAHAHGDAPTAVDAVMERFLQARSDVAAHLFEDTTRALGALRAAGLPVGALTNGNADVRRFESVSKLFDFARRAEDAGASKPHPSPFWHAVYAARVGRPRALVHVGDEVKSDLVGALDAGCRAVLLTRAGRERKPEELAAMPPADPSRWREVATLDEAVEVILAWRAEAKQEQQ